MDSKAAQEADAARSIGRRTTGERRLERLPRTAEERRKSERRSGGDRRSPD